MSDGNSVQVASGVELSVRRLLFAESRVIEIAFTCELGLDYELAKQVIAKLDAEVTKTAEVCLIRGLEGLAQTAAACCARRHFPVVAVHVESLNAFMVVDSGQPRKFPYGHMIPSERLRLEKTPRPSETSTAA